MCPERLKKQQALIPDIDRTLPSGRSQKWTQLTVCLNVSVKIQVSAKSDIRYQNPGDRRDLRRPCGAL